MPFSLAGHVAVVTGSSTGLGKAIALTLGKAGAKVAVNYLNNQARAEKALAELRAAGADVAARAGQIVWSRSMASELAPFGITVNTVAPGWIPVERHEKDPQEAKDAYFKLIPAGRWGVPQDVADAVLYFASEEASFVTGQTL